MDRKFWATWIDSDIIQKWDHGQQFCSAANSSLVMPLPSPCVNYVSMLLNYPNLNTTFNTLAQTYFQNPSNLMQDWKGALHFFSIWKTGAVPSTTWGHYDKKIESHHHYFIFLDFQPSNTQKKMKNQTNISKSLTGLGLKLPDPPSHSHFFGRSISGHKNWLEAMHHLTLHRPCRRQVTPLLDGNAALVGT